MSQTTHTAGLLETLRVRRGVIEDVRGHQRRMDRSFEERFGRPAPDLVSILRDLCGEVGSIAPRMEDDADQLLRLVWEPGLRVGHRPAVSTRAPRGIPSRVTVALAKHPRSDPPSIARHKSWPRDAAVFAGVEGCFETLLHASNGSLLEGLSSNLLIRCDGEWRTPPVSDGLVPGVVRARVLDLAERWGAPIEVRTMHRDELDRCDGMVLVGTGVDLLAVDELGGRELDPETGAALVDRWSSALREGRRADGLPVDDLGRDAVGA